jgi:hypothetical protein
VSQIIKTISGLGKQILKSLIYILPISILVGCANAYLVKQKPPIYTSYSKIFPLSTGGGNDASSMIRSQFGLGPTSDEGRFYNVNELLKSNTLSRSIVQYPTNDASNLKLYEWIIKDYNEGKYWNSDKINLSKDSMENIITASHLVRNQVIIKTEKSEFTAINVTANNSQLALRINECVLSSLSDFYIQSKTQKARKDLESIKDLQDSLYKALDAVQRASLGFQDDTKYLVKDAPLLPKLKLEQLREEITEAYKVTATTRQNANFRLLNESPIFQVLDKPVGPVDKVVASVKKAFLIAFTIAFFLLAIFSIRKFIFQIIMAELKAA